MDQLIDGQYTYTTTAGQQATININVIQNNIPPFSIIKSYNVTMSNTAYSRFNGQYMITDETHDNWDYTQRIYKYDKYMLKINENDINDEGYHTIALYEFNNSTQTYEIIGAMEPFNYIVSGENYIYMINDQSQDTIILDIRYI